jgi:pimeloyl-ACP methyl ester carboxylesterase
MPRATVQDGIEIEYEIRGEGEPILFVMGLAGQLIDWPDEFVELFVAEGYQVIRFDNRDSGLSSKTDWKPPSHLRQLWAAIRRKPVAGAGYTLDDMADDAAGLLDTLQLDAAHIVGASMGGMISQTLATRHPERVRSLCSIMSNTGDRKHGLFSWRLVARLAKRRRPSRKNAVDYTVAVMEAISGPTFDAGAYRVRATASIERMFTPAGVMRQATAVAASPDRTEALGGIQCPTLVIHGMVDPLVKPSGGTATAKAVPNARLLMFPEMGHDLPSGRWDEIRDEIVANCRRA